MAALGFVWADRDVQISILEPPVQVVPNRPHDAARILRCQCEFRFVHLSILKFMPNQITKPNTPMTIPSKTKNITKIQLISDDLSH